MVSTWNLSHWLIIAALFENPGLQFIPTGVMLVTDDVKGGIEALPTRNVVWYILRGTHCFGFLAIVVRHVIESPHQHRVENIGSPG